MINFSVSLLKVVDQGRAVSFVGPCLVGLNICLMRVMIHRLAERDPSIIRKLKRKRLLTGKRLLIVKFKVFMYSFPTKWPSLANEFVVGFRIKIITQVLELVDHSWVGNG